MGTKLEKELVVRPWGNFIRYTQNQSSTVKIITVMAGEELSLQYHSKRSEFWRILRGNPTITIGEEVIQAKPGDEFSVGEGVNHRIAANENEVEILEIGLGEFDETDIVRLEDKYGRKNQ